MKKRKITSQALMVQIMDLISEFFRSGGSLGDAFGALKMAKLTVEMSFVKSAQELEEHDPYAQAR